MATGVYAPSKTSASGAKVVGSSLRPGAQLVGQALRLPPFGSASDAVALQMIHSSFRPARENILCQCFQPAEQILFAGDSDDLVAELAVLKKKQRWNRPN